MVLTGYTVKNTQQREAIRSNNSTTVEESTVERTPGAEHMMAHQVARKIPRPQPWEDGAEGDISERPSRSVSSDLLKRLNLDVIFLVASQMHPVDLFSLACTCKSLRYILMDKSASFAWRAARLHIEGLPDCPVDLSEQQYARLLFNNNCQSCEDRAGEIFWKIQRRYCSTCRVKRLYPLASCENPIREGGILPTEILETNHRYHYLCTQEHDRKWVDREQLEALMDKLHTTSDPTQLLDDMRKRYRHTIERAKKGAAWQWVVTEARTKTIIDRLFDLGYQHEIGYHGLVGFKKLYKSAFTSVRPLTNTEWERILPRLVEITQEIKMHKANEWTYQQRLRKLEYEYEEWVRCPPTEPTSDILPHVMDLASLPSFDAIVKTPEDIDMRENIFSSAFMELPTMARKWRNQVDAEIAALCAVARRDMTAPASTGVTEGEESQSTHHSEWLEAGKYALASITFCLSTPRLVLCHYPELLFFPIFQSNASFTDRHLTYFRPNYPWSTMDKTGRPVVRLCREASYVVRACGLDPAVATADDMERRNARLICLRCDNARLVRSWTTAICHAELRHSREQPDPTVPRWRLVDDEHVDLIESIEDQGGLEPPKENHFRCLLCKPRAGDLWLRSDALKHLAKHGVKRDVARVGVHYAPLQCIDVASNSVSVVEMLEDEEGVTFRVTS